MALGLAAGYPDYSGSPTHYIPQLYAKKMRVKYYANAVMSGIANTEFEGMIKKQGDKVEVRQVPSVTINNHSKGQTLNYEKLSADALELTIDYAKDYAFVITDEDKAQTDQVLDDKFIKDAEHQMEVDVDTGILADIYGSVDSSNAGTTAGAISGNIDLGAAADPDTVTEANATDKLFDFKQILTEQNVPDDGNRWVVLPAWYINLLDKSDLADASYSGDSSSRIYSNKQIGTLAGFKVHESNLLATSTEGSDTAFHMMFGHRDALTFAAQLVKNRSMELESVFGTGYSGLFVYGYKVIVPEAMGYYYAVKG